MGKRGADTRRPLSRIGIATLKKIPAGNMLDQAIVFYRPRPELLGSAPGDVLLRTLRCERNLYAACLDAVTGDPDAILRHPDSKTDRVRRALAYNPRLSESDRSELADMALRTNSAPLVMAILDGTTRITHTLTAHPELLGVVSVRAGQAAPLAVARNLHEATAADIEHLRTKFESFGNRADTPLRSVVLEATRILLGELHDGRRTSELHTLSALCSLVSGVPGWGLRTLHLPAAAYAQLEELPGRVVLPISSVFSVRCAGDYYASHPLTNAWDYSESAALDCEFENQARRWSDAAVAGTAATLADTFTELDQLQAFESLLPEWTGTLRELLVAAVAL
jgi:hypothetical protein